MRTALGPKHPSLARDPRAIGVANGSDDAVFAVTGWSAPFFVTHLVRCKPDARPALLRWLRPRPA
jgi:hypothetical protein